MPSKEIYYSDKYNDETHEYRHVILPKVALARAKTTWLTCFVSGSGEA